MRFIKKEWIVPYFSTHKYGERINVSDAINGEVMIMPDSKDNSKFILCYEKKVWATKIITRADGTTEIIK